MHALSRENETKIVKITHSATTISYSNLKSPFRTLGLYTLGTVVVDYRGYRVTAQSIIPGILEREQEQSVVYGSIDFGKTVVTHPKYMDLLQKAGSQLKILPHTVINGKDEEVILCFHNFFFKSIM